MINKFLEFVNDTPTAFHACSKFVKNLEEKGFKRIIESEVFSVEKGGKYYVTRNGSCVLAFTIPTDINELSYNIVATHLDSPTFKLKPNFEMVDSRYKRLNTEVYGGPIYSSWFDRPLNIAGRIIYKDGNSIKTKLVSFDKPMAIIPNCSIHYNRELNSGYKFNPQSDLLPIYAIKNNGDTDLLDLVSKECNIEKERIVSHDLYLAILDRGTLLGANDEFVCAPQIDNLECSVGAVEALINSENDKSVNMVALFDNEETGSRTRQGAASQMLSDVLESISLSLGKTALEHKAILSSSFIISADNAQGFHPNYASKFDPTNATFMNEGIVVKSAARGSYTTDGFSLAYFTSICKEANAKCQLNTNRSDVPGGSTLGAISLGNVSIASVDIGLPQVAMHSAYETAGANDFTDYIKALEKFYSKHIKFTNDCEMNY